MNKKTALFLTYNSIGDPGTFGSGPIERGGNTAVIVQHGRGQQWGVPQMGSPNHVDIARTLVTELGSQLPESLENIDRVVVYVGDRGSEGAIDIASRFPAEKVSFVLCRCNMTAKQASVNRKCKGAQVIMCECGGNRTMRGLVEAFLTSGELSGNRN